MRLVHGLFDLSGVRGLRKWLDLREHKVRSADSG